MKYIIFLLAATSASLLISCTRASKPEVSSLKFDFSKVSQKGGGIIPQSAIPAGSEVCYGVNVVASDIELKNNKCAPALGAFAGFIPEAKELSIEIPFGKDREVQLYAYLPKTGSTCINANENGGSGLDPQSIYLVGKMSNVVFDQPEVTLAMPVAFPGVAHSIYADLNMDPSCLKTVAPPIAVDPNAPVVLHTVISTTSITTSGIDETITLQMLIKSNTPVNYLTLSHDGPNGNISGGGSSHLFYACTLAHIATLGHVCEKGTVNDYYGTTSITVSQWAQNGTYSLNFSVRNSLFINSAIVQAPSYTIINHPVVVAPTLVNVVLSPAASLTSGGGGNVDVKFLVQSSVSPDWVEKSLRRPDMSFVNGGGAGATFSNCSPFTASVGHICYGYNTTYWYYSVIDSINSYQQNGTYSYVNIRVRNQAGLYSAVWGSTPIFTVAGNVAATVPVILQTDGYYAFDNDPFNYGIPYYSGTCIRPEGTNLSLGVRIKSTSNVPTNWINYLLQGPTSTIMGGGNGSPGFSLGGGNWQNDLTGFVYSVTSAQAGLYAWHGLTVQNQGDLVSSPVAGPSINLQNSCPTHYINLSSFQNVPCAVTNTNKIKCWGSNASNLIDHGSVSIPRKFPTVVDGYNNYIQVARGLTHTCALDLSNRIRCWGQNTYGQLGDGTLTSQLRPIQIDANIYLKLSAGQNHTCAINSSGELKCWGKNNIGQLGDGTTIDKYVPTWIDAGVTYQSVDVGEQHTCGITTSGVLKCWGYNINGQVGDATNTNRASPTIINSGTTYVHVDAGSTHTCGVTSAGILRCWGFNPYGQIGDGSTTNRTSPVTADAGVTYVKASAFGSHSCGITNTGNIKCWGQNTYGQLGDGTSANRVIPTLTSGGHTYGNVSVGNGFTCAITSSGQMKCWGQNIGYQLGNGTTSGSNFPIDIDL